MYYIYVEKETPERVYIGTVDTEEETLHETLETLITKGYHITKIFENEETKN